MGGVEYDALIVGGRAAGGSLSLLLARQGRNVLVVDRDEFPSDTMSTHFMNLGAVGALRRLGVLNDIIAAGFRRVTRHRTWVGDCCFEGPAGPPGAFGLCPRRVVLDAVVLDHAVKAGATFEQKTRVDGLLHDSDRITGAVLQAVGGERREVRARVVVGADGKSSKVAEWVAAAEYDAVAALRPAYYGYFHGIEPRPEPTLELFFGGDNITFFFPMREGEDCIAIEIQPEEFESFRSNLGTEFEARVRRLPEMRRRMQNAHLEGKLMGVKGIDNFFRKPYGPGWALTGDAGYLKDPSTGTGIGDAMEQSFLLAEALGAAFDGGDWEAAMSAFQTKRDHLMRPSYEATLAFTRMRDMSTLQEDVLRAVFLSPGTTRAVANGIVSQLADLLPPAEAERVKFISRLFAPAPEPTKA
jgi:flavin-dependent dehydrogenase